LGPDAAPLRADLVAAAQSAILWAMRMIVACLCLMASPSWAWEFSAQPICTLSQEAEDGGVVVTYDPQIPVYAITVRRTTPWPSAPVFAMRFEGVRGNTISTSRHRLSEGGLALTVTDSGFGNVLDGLQYNDTATALAGSSSLRVSLDDAAPAVAAFRACVAAPSV
jgi:hypothetical protein